MADLPPGISLFEPRIGDYNTPTEGAIPPGISQVPPTLAEGTPIVSQETRQRRARNRARWLTRSGGEKGEAMLRSAAHAVPIAGPSISSGDNPLLQEFEDADPGAATVMRLMGNTLPYMATAAIPGIGPAMWGTIPRAMLSGATIGGSDAIARGQDPIVGAGSGVVTTLTGGTIGKMVTPRTPQRIIRERMAINNEAMRNARSEYNEAIRDPVLLHAQQRLLNRINPNVSAGHPDSAESIHAGITRQNDAIWNDILRRHIDAVRNVNPRRRIYGLSDLNPIAQGLLGAAGGALMGRHPIEGGALGIALGQGERLARHLGERVVNTRAANRYFNNTIINPELREMLHAIAASGAPSAENVTSARPYETLTGK